MPQQNREIVNAVSLKNLTVKFGNQTILNTINLDLAEKEFLGIIGPNGGGKTTFLKTIMGFITPSAGSVSIFGKNPKDSGGTIGYVPQYSTFESHFPVNVTDVIKMGTYTSKVSKVIIDSLIDDILKKTRLSHLAKRQVSELSGGEKQRVLISRALAVQPKILILDEPTASIDYESNINFFEILKELNKDITILLVSHDIGVISRHVKKIACLNRELHYHDSKEISQETLEAVYKCPVDLIAHGVPHRVLETH